MQVSLASGPTVDVGAGGVICDQDGGDPFKFHPLKDNGSTITSALLP
jgi:hypothetical protein